MDKEERVMKRTKLGTALYEFTNKAGKFLGNHLWLYYFLNYTWGIIMSLVGWIALGFCKMILKKKISKHGPSHYVIVGSNWGGLELGQNFLIADGMGKDWTEHSKNHELGHTFQNAIYGPLFVFLVAIPSAVRYWHQRIGRKKGKAFPSDWYDSAWFEGSATHIGTEYMKEKASEM